jgi:arginyl-tRNA synthetase
MKNLQQTIHERFLDAFRRMPGPDVADADPMIRRSTDPRFGDFQSNCAMGLAKRIGAKPRDVAERIKAALSIDDICDEPEIAGPGFINLRLRREFMAQQLERISPGDDRLTIGPVTPAQTVVVDYSSPNIAKQMHVGHLRSTIIGDVISRVIVFQGHRVIRQNHLGDWGLPLAMLVTRWKDVKEEEKPADPAALLEFLEGLYRQANEEIETNPEFEKQAREILYDIQHGRGEARRYWQEIKHASMTSAYEMYRRLDVLLTEADEYGESAYRDALADTVKELEDIGAVEESEGARCIFMEGFRTREDTPLPLIIQKTDGSFLYATTDLAAMRYRIRELKADRIIYVTDARQKLHFEMVFAAAAKAGWLLSGDRTVSLEHVTFGSVLGEDGKPLKTRSGENVKLKDLLDEAVQRGADLAVQNENDPARARGLGEDEIRRIGEAVGIGAVKYADLSQNRTTDYVFSWSKMLAMDGNTAPYLMYAYARIRSIYRKGIEAGHIDADSIAAANVDLSEPAERELALQILQLADVVDQVARELKPNVLTAYLYDLATAFMRFYETCPVLKAGSESMRNARLRLCDLTASALRLGLELLGIRPLERM